MNKSVLLIIEGWHTGGTEQYVARLAEYLSRTGRFDVHLAVLLAWQQERLDQARSCGARVHLLGGPLPRALWRLGRLVQRLRPAVCHCHLYASLLPVTLLLRMARVSRVVTTLHSPLTAWCPRHRLMWRAAVRLADQVAGVSRAAVRSLPGSECGPTGRVHVVPPPIVDRASREAIGRATVDSQREAFTVVGCGRLSPEKDWPTLIRGFAVLAPGTKPPARLVLLGEGPEEQRLRSLVADLGLCECATFLGRREHGEAMAVVAGADVCVLPSCFEGLGIAALESMLQGVPTITADFEASFDFLRQGVTGHRFPRGDYRRLGELLCWHRDHPELSRAMGRRGQRFVQERFSEEKTFAFYEKIYCGEVPP